MPKANEMVQWTISSDERRELKRAAGPASRAFDAQIDPLDRFAGFAVASHTRKINGLSVATALLTQ